MNAKELLAENERLKKLLSEKEAALATTQQRLAEAAAQHGATVEQFSQSLEEKDRKVAALEHQVKLLLQRIRGSRQERINPDQLLLFSLEELQQIAQQLEEGDPADELIDDRPAGKKGKKRRRRRGLEELLEKLPKETVRHELNDSQRACPCCGEKRDEFGVETSYQLEIIPARLKVLQHDRVKYVCRSCEGQVAVADKPPQPIEKGLAAPGLCAHTVLSKFGDHTPLYRQEDIHSRLGCTIRRSTLCGWQAQLAELALPLVMRMKHLVLQSKVIHTDDTSIKMLAPGTGATRTCKFWPYLGDWLHPYAVYDFTLTRERDGPQKFLADFQGYLQADAYSGYDCVYAGERVKEVACGIHARRYWHQALDNDPVRANTALGFIARLSQVESQLLQAYPYQNLQGERDFASVRAGRQEFTMPILQEYKAWLDQESQDDRILPKSPIRAAFTYTLNQWDALCRYTEEGYLSMENNAAERLVKLPAIGRKNFLFVGSERGGRGAATMYSLVSSAKANGVEPFAWLKEIFTRLPYHRGGEAYSQAAAEEPVTSQELDYLLPDKWLAANPSQAWQIDHIRRAERKPKPRRSRPRKKR
jgi:transposase